MSESICPTSWSTPSHQFHSITLPRYFLHLQVWFSCQSHHLPPSSLSSFELNALFQANNFQSSPYFLHIPSSSFHFPSFTVLVSVNAFNQWILSSARDLFPLYLNQIISLPQISAVWCHHCYRGKTTFVFTGGAQTMAWIPAQQSTPKNSSLGKISRGKFWTCTHVKQEAQSVSLQ